MYLTGIRRQPCEELIAGNKTADEVVDVLRHADDFAEVSVKPVRVSGEGKIIPFRRDEVNVLDSVRLGDRSLMDAFKIVCRFFKKYGITVKVFYPDGTKWVPSAENAA